LLGAVTGAANRRLRETPSAALGITEAVAPTDGKSAKETQMIHEVRGDILLSEAAVLAHGVAPNDDFANGLARALRERWPALYKDFRHYCHVHHPTSGGLWLWGGPGIRIANLLTQAAAQGHGHPGRATSEYVNAALRALRHAVHEEHFASVALPRLATGVGGMEWETVRPLIERHLGDLDVPVWLYTIYEAGRAAEER
jgi:O-acetyl-ADP-ribose deacetylase (regulator of RNase III)